MNSLTLFVHGIPSPQGSKRHIGRGIMVEANKNTRPWRQSVTCAAALELNGRPPLDGPLLLRVEFRFPRLKQHLGKDGTPKPTAAVLKESAPDLDKLLRAIGDGLADAGAFRNDAQISQVIAKKIYADHPGAEITLLKVNK